MGSWFSKVFLVAALALLATPAAAMFLQPDTWEVTQPGVGTNRFAYSGGDPVNQSDPGGNSWLDRSWDYVFGQNSFNNTFGDSGTVWSDRNFGNGGEQVSANFYGDGAGGNASYSDYKSANADRNSVISDVMSRDSVGHGDMFLLDTALIGSGAGAVYKVGRWGYAALVGARNLALERAALKIGSEALYKSTDLSVAGRALTKHPNVAGFSTGEELFAALKTPQALNEAASMAVSNILRQGSRVDRYHATFGQIIEFNLPSGIGVRFSANFDFIGFLGR